MIKKLKFFVFLFLPIALFGKSVEIVQDLVGDLLDSNFPLFIELKEALAQKNSDCTVINLTTKQHQSASTVIFWNIPFSVKDLNLKAIPKKKMILFMLEPPTVMPHLYRKKYQELFSKIYTWDDDLVDNKKFFKFYYPVLKPSLKEEEIPSFEQKKLCTAIFSCKTSKHPKQLYGEREKAFRFFETVPEEDFEFYGYGWDSAQFKRCRGAVADKLPVMKNYRFAICYENMGNVKGYITEKIFDCFLAGSVPIYLGASNVEQYIPKSCFVDRRDFASDEELYAFIKKVTAEEYAEYRNNIKNFLKSDKAQLFSREHFIATTLKALDL